MAAALVVCLCVFLVVCVCKHQQDHIICVVVPFCLLLIILKVPRSKATLADQIKVYGCTFDEILLLIPIDCFFFRTVFFTTSLSLEAHCIVKGSSE